ASRHPPRCLQSARAPRRAPSNENCWPLRKPALNGVEGARRATSAVAMMQTINECALQAPNRGGADTGVLQERRTGADGWQGRHGHPGTRACYVITSDAGVHLAAHNE